MDSDGVLITTKGLKDRMKSMTVMGKIHNDRRRDSGFLKVGATMSWGDPRTIYGAKV